MLPPATGCASNSAGQADSNTATITVGATAPSITTQPASQTITSGQTATLTVTASGTAPLSYQWYQGTSGTTTTPVGANAASFTTPALRRPPALGPREQQRRLG